MNRKMIASMVLMTFMLFLLSSCASIPEEHRGAATGAGIGAATGAVAGALLGDDTKSTMLGAMIGALAGGVIGHYAYDQNKSRQETQQTYNYKPAYGTVLTIEEASASPATVHPGETVELKMSYAILNPSAGMQTNLTETRSITHHGELVGNPETRVTRSDGTYTSTIPLHLPANADKGTYAVTSTVQTENAKDTKEFTFEVN